MLCKSCESGSNSNVAVLKEVLHLSCFVKMSTYVDGSTGIGLYRRRKLELYREFRRRKMATSSGRKNYQVPVIYPGVSLLVPGNIISVIMLSIILLQGRTQELMEGCFYFSSLLSPAFPSTTYFPFPLPPLPYPFSSLPVPST